MLAGLPAEGRRHEGLTEGCVSLGSQERGLGPEADLGAPFGGQVGTPPCASSSPAAQHRSPEKLTVLNKGG